MVPGWSASKDRTLMEILHKLAILGGKTVYYPLAEDVTFKKAQRVR